MTKEFNSLDEIQKYYDEDTNTYIFKEDEEYIGLVMFNFDLDVKANIEVCNIIARDISAWNIDAYNINAWDINACNISAFNINAGSIHVMNIEARNINARDIKTNNIYADDINAFDIKAKCITYWAVCFAYNNIKCKSIKGRRINAKHFVLDGKLEVENE